MLDPCINTTQLLQERGDKNGRHPQQENAMGSRVVEVGDIFAFGNGYLYVVQVQKHLVLAAPMVGCSWWEDEYERGYGVVPSRADGLPFLVVLPMYAQLVVTEDLLEMERVGSNVGIYRRVQKVWERLRSPEGLRYQALPTCSSLDLDDSGEEHHPLAALSQEGMLIWARVHEVRQAGWWKAS